MSMKKAVKRRSENEGNFRIFPWIFFVTKKKVHDWTLFVNKQGSDLVKSFKSSKKSTKVVLVSVFLFLFFFAAGTIAHSFVSISDKKAELENLDKQIEFQKNENEKLENQFTGDLDELMEEKAREDLEMIYPDEHVFINKAG